MTPKYWGRYGWYFFHLVTYGYPKNPTEIDKQHYREYITALQFALPCSKCRRHMTEHLKKYPLTNDVMSSRTNLVKWGIDFHNIVNDRTDKPMLSYPEAMNEIDKLMTPKKTSTAQILLYIVTFIAIIILCYLIYYYVIKKN
jgi:hypothetical protein